ncbi:hypothetical protein IMSAGC019_03337 [Lachnospiraceae bacterium]|nr:hypothetical protein IMSAGC019_03337 [Lachnospiraceae bacterium]
MIGKMSIEKISKIFLLVLLGISLLVHVDVDIGGVELSVFLLLLLCVIGAVFQIVFIYQNESQLRSIKYFADYVALAIIGWELLVVLGKLLTISTEEKTDYNFNILMIVLATLYFWFSSFKLFEKWYLDVILYANLIIICIFLLCYVCSMNFSWLAGGMIGNSGRAASYLLIPCIVSTYQYCMGRDKFRSGFYFASALVSFFALFINHNIVSFWLMGAVFIGIPVLFRPTAELVKRDMQLFFCYIFFLSNMSLIANYTSLFQVPLSFDLEHSVYLELLLAIGGAFFFTYWDKIPEGIDLNKLVLRKMRRQFHFLLKLIGVLFAGIILGGDRWRESGEKIASFIAGFAFPLVEEVRRGKSGFVFSMEESVISGLLIFVMAVLLLIRMQKNYSFGKPQTGLFILVSYVFLLQLLFWTPDAGTLLVYFMIFVMAAFYKEEREKVTSVKINFYSKESVKDEEKNVGF